LKYTGCSFSVHTTYPVDIVADLVVHVHCVLWQDETVSEHPSHSTTMSSPLQQSGVSSVSQESVSHSDLVVQPKLSSTEQQNRELAASSVCIS